MENINKLFSSRMKDKLKLNNDEHFIDGLIYCKSCNTPRSVKINNVMYRCLCECQSQEYENNIKCKEENEILEQIAKLRSDSLLGKRFMKCTFETTKIVNDSFKNAFERCKAYCNAYGEVLDKGYGMFIFGGSGIGKTHLTACMVNELSKNFQMSITTNFFEISKKIRGNWDNEEAFIDKLTKIDFLFIDDFGTEIVKRKGEDNFLQEKIYEIINMRYNNLKPTIFTSNYSLNALVAERGFLEKTIDRIREMSNRIIKIEGESFRDKGEEYEIKSKNCPTKK